METLAPESSALGAQRVTSRPARGRPGLASIAALLIALGAIGVAIFANPSVSTFDIQRRDRLAPSARFVSFAYAYLLNRPPDVEGSTSYQRMFDERGPETVAAAIIQSAEFRNRARTAATDAPRTDDVALAKQVVSAYDAGQAQQASALDGPGRIGFVGVLLLVLVAVARLRHHTRQLPHVDLGRVSVPGRYVTGIFAALVVMTWVSSDLLLYAFASSRFVYIEWLSQVTALSATRGPTNVWTPYPQGVQDVLLALNGVSDAIAASLASDVWTTFSIFRVLFQVVFLLIPSILTVAVVSTLGNRISPATGTVAAIGAAFSIAPIYYGVLATNVVDPLPAFLTVLAVWWLATGRHTLSGLAIGAGAVLKLFPILLLPVALIHARTWHARVRVTVAASVVLASTLLAPALANFDIFMSPLRWQTGRPAWESWYAFGNWVISAPHEYRMPYFTDISVGDSFGWVFWGITPRISALLTPVPAAPIRWENALSLCGTVAVVLFCLSARSRSTQSLVRWSLLVLAGSLFWSTGWSPQYELFIIPFVLLAVRPPMVGLISALLLEGLTLLEYPVLLPWSYFYGGSVVWIMWAALLGRYVVLGWLCLYVVEHEASLATLRARLGAVLRRPPGRLAAPTGVAAALVLVACSSAPPAQAAQIGGTGPCGPSSSTALPQAADLGLAEADWPMLAGHFYSQAGTPPEQGFAITDDNQASFWSEFQRLGGWQVLGYPATRRFNWHGQLSQTTQRAILQWSPVTGQVEVANVLDLLHEQGLDDSLLQLDQIPPPADAEEAGLPFETIAEHRLQWLDERPAIKRKYCDTPGGTDPLLLWGLPTSPPVNMSSTGTVYVVRTQRAAFQEWVDGAPWAAPGEVTTVLAGDLAKQFNLVPADSVLPEQAPAR